MKTKLLTPLEAAQTLLNLEQEPQTLLAVHDGEVHLVSLLAQETESYRQAIAISSEEDRATTLGTLPVRLEPLRNPMHIQHRSLGDTRVYLLQPSKADLPKAPSAPRPKNTGLLPPPDDSFEFHVALVA